MGGDRCREPERSRRSHPRRRPLPWFDEPDRVVAEIERFLATAPASGAEAADEITTIDAPAANTTATHDCASDVDVVEVGTASTTHMPHGLCLAGAGRSRFARRRNAC